MTEKDEREILSRRRFSILGLATLGLTLSSTVLMISEVEAQPSTAPLLKFGATATPETVTQRRLARTQRRLARRQARAERRRTRRGTAPATSTTPQ
jgi:hypothetical protein